MSVSKTRDLRAHFEELYAQMPGRISGVLAPNFERNPRTAFYSVPAIEAAWQMFQFGFDAAERRL